MRVQFYGPVLLAFLVPLMSPRSSVADESSGDESGGRILILLVGVSEYPFTKVHDLKGPPNDVVLAREVLKARFGEKRIAYLRVLAAVPDADGEPTRVNIEKEFAVLADNAMPGDQVFILMAGHGSQQPDQNGDERDGADELFLPKDIEGWRGTAGTVTNSISDDELAVWLKKIQDKQASIFFVADSCHSGTLARGDSAVSREVKASDLGIPENVFVRPRGPEVDVHDGGTEQSRLVALYGAHANQSAYEETVPDAHGKPHGWLSWALFQVLQTNKGPLSYEELARRIDWVYAQNGWTSCRPLMIGESLETEVLGKGNLGFQRQLSLKRQGRRLIVDGGSLQGITEDSILEALDRDKKRVGYLTVTKAGPVTAEVMPVEHNETKEPSTEDLRAAVECRLAVRDLGLPDLFVFLETFHVPSARRMAIQRNVAAALKNLRESPAPIEVRLTENRSHADVALVYEGLEERHALAAMADVIIESDGTPKRRPGSFWVATSDEELSDDLRKMLAAINLTGMSELDTGEDPTMKIELVRERQIGRNKWERLTDSSVLRNNDKIRVTVHNSGRQAADVTVLYVANDWSVQSFFPQYSVGVDNRLGPGEKQTLPTITINDNTIGLEHLMVVAVHSKALIPVNFKFLEQVGLRPALRRGPGDDRASRGPEETRHPLDAILKGRMQGTERGADVLELGDYAIKRHSWVVE